MEFGLCSFKVVLFIYLLELNGFAIVYRCQLHVPSQIDKCVLLFVQDPNLVVEAMTSTGSSQSARPSVRSTSATATESARPRAAGS